MKFLLASTLLPHSDYGKVGQLWKACTSHVFLLTSFGKRKQEMDWQLYLISSGIWHSTSFDHNLRNCFSFNLRDLQSANLCNLWSAHVNPDWYLTVLIGYMDTTHLINSLQNWSISFIICLGFAEKCSTFFELWLQDPLLSYKSYCKESEDRCH